MNNILKMIRICGHFSILCFILIGTSCDDREASETLEEEGMTLTILNAQPVSNDDSQTAVGEMLVGYTNMWLDIVLKDADNKAVKDKIVSFSAEVNEASYGTFDLDDPKTDTDGLATVFYTDGAGSGAVDDGSTPAYEGVILTAKYNDNVKSSTRFSVYGNKSDIWPYKLFLSTSTDQILLDNGATTAEIEVRLYNQQDKVIDNVTVYFESDKGYLDPEGTTDSTGILKLTFRDNGEQEDIGLATIRCMFTHPGIDSSVTDSVQITIGTNSGLTLETTPISYQSGSTQIVVGEDIIGDIAVTRIVASVHDSSGNGLSGQLVNLKATVLGVEVGSLEIISNETDDQGNVYAYFDDGGNSYLDIAGTTEFDGVVISAYLGDSTSAATKTAPINVYPEDAWPYVLYLNSDVDKILLDNGITTAQIEARVENQYNAVVQNVTLYFESDKGTIDPTGVTDGTGVITLTFSDNGTQEDIGLANISASFQHPGFNATIMDSVQIAIGTNNGLALEIIPVSYDQTGSTVIVGEDIVGDAAGTLLVATVTDTSQNPISGIPVEFTATSGSDAVGTISYDNSVSNTDGQVVGYFDDGGTGYTDNPGTPNYEGVSVVAYFGDKVTDPQTFNVYDEDDVWPYSLYLTTDTDVIQLDGGETYANLAARLLNKLGNPIDNAQIAYSATKGYINSIGYTDSTGVDSIIFTDLGDEEDLGVSDITATFIHPGFSDNSISDLLQIYIEDPSFQSCAYIEIPTCSPSHIVVREGGGIESTLIRARLYDDNDNLINTPTLVRFVLNPILDGCYLEEPAVFDTSVYTVNGIASVSVNSGTEPGPVRIEVSTDCDLDGNVDLEANAVPLIIEAGPPRYIYTDWNPLNAQTPGGGIYQIQVSAIVKDRYHNPVEDSTYVYWTMSPVEPDTIVEAEIEGVSLTYNEGEIDGADPIHGVAFSTVTYYPDAIGQLGIITTYTWGDDINGDGIYGDSIGTMLDGGEVTFGFVPGTITLMSSASYHDFTLNGNPAQILITAIVNDFYGNAVVDAPIAFSGQGVDEWLEVWYEVYTDEGVNEAGVDDGCFTWRDYGADDNPTTSDWGNFNNNHDSFDTDEDGQWDVAEVSEPFDDYGMDNQPDTGDEGEGDGEWDGYSMIGCEAIVHTDEDGMARIIVQYDQEICTLASQDNETDPPTCTWDPFTSSITATILLPQITTSDPLDILLVRSPGECD